MEVDTFRGRNRTVIELDVGLLISSLSREADGDAVGRIDFCTDEFYESARIYCGEQLGLLRVRSLFNAAVGECGGS